MPHRVQKMNLFVPQYFCLTARNDMPETQKLGCLYKSASDSLSFFYAISFAKSTEVTQNTFPGLMLRKKLN